MTRRRVCATCGVAVRSERGRWRHDERRIGRAAATRSDDDHRPVATWGTPAASLLPAAAAEKQRNPRTPTQQVREPVRWGPTLPFERWSFNPDRVRDRGCLTAAGLDVIGEL